MKKKIKYHAWMLNMTSGLPETREYPFESDARAFVRGLPQGTPATILKVETVYENKAYGRFKAEEEAARKKENEKWDY